MKTKKTSTKWLLELFCKKVAWLKELGYSEEEAKKVVKDIMAKAVDIVIA